MKSLRILHVANRAEKQLGRRFYSLPYKINNGLVREGHNVYWFSDRDVARSSGLLPSPKLGRAACNRKLLELCANFRPDLLLLAHADLIDNATLAEAKRRYGVPIAQYNIDLLHTDNVARLRQRNGIVDQSFVTTGGSWLRNLAGAGTVYRFMPNPVDGSIDSLENFRTAQLPIDVFFAGQASSLAAPDSLRSLLPRLPADLAGVSFGFHSQVWGADYLGLLAQARIGLSISVGLEQGQQGDGSPEYLYSSDRISQYLGNGLLTFVEKRFCLAELYGADALVEVAGYADLKEHLTYYLANDGALRQRAATGHRLAHAEFNERLVCRYLLEATCGIPFSRDYHWPTAAWGA